MKFNAQNVRIMRDLLTRPIPEDVDVNIWEGGDVMVQASTQDAVQRFRAAFPGTIWTKRYSEDCQWWEYIALVGDIHVNIFACYEAPPTCRAIEEEVEVEKQVPTGFTTVRVKEKRVRWECGDGAKERSA
jgi:hypothetical protein